LSGENGFDVDVRALILEKIDSIEHIEILLYLAANPDVPTTADAVAQKLRISADSAALRLADLAQKGLARASDTPPAYVFHPESERLAAAVAKLQAAYRERRVSVINLIFSKPLAKIQVFADAFKIRKD
jgi:hypothetical protein